MKFREWIREASLREVLNTEGIIHDLARKNDLEYSTFSLSNQGLFYRSDQFSFARYDIPSVWISAGEDEERCFLSCLLRNSNRSRNLFALVFILIDVEYFAFDTEYWL